MNFVAHPPLQIDRLEIFVLVGSGFVESAIFFLAGWPLAYAPVYLTNIVLDRPGLRGLAAYAVAGLLLGIIFLPVCASVPFIALRSVVDPTYSARCIEFAYPMAIAGIIGGYAFWRFARRTAQNDERIADQFS
jgi:hypothetical protein